MRTRKLMTLVATLTFMVVLPATVGAAGYEWRDHQAPFDFTFGNHIDTHQQALTEGDDGLVGFLYITPSNETTDDGVPIAMHGDCSQNPSGCTVGWILHGLATEAQYCGHVSGEHPAWAIPADDIPSQRGFTHFHWLNETPHHGGLIVGDIYSGRLLKLTAVETFVFSHHGAFLVEPGIDFETHANVFAACEDWPHFGHEDDGHGH